MMSASRAQATLVYDSDCGFCTTSVKWLKKRDKRHSFEASPYQTPGLHEQAGISEAQAQNEAWFLYPDGRKAHGAGAINAALGQLGPVFRVLSWLYRVPGLRQLQDLAYRAIARNRHRMPGGTDACALPRR